MRAGRFAQLLRLRKEEERQAAKLLAEMRGRHEECAARVAKNRKERLRAERDFNEQAVHGITASVLHAHREALQALDGEFVQLEAELAVLAADVERQLTLLLERSQAKQMMEKLDDGERERLQAEQVRREHQMADEQAHKRGGGDGA